MPSAETPVRASSAYTTPAICGLLLLAVALVFGKTVLYDFVNYDDAVFVYENPIVARGVTAQGIVWAFTTSVGSMGFPLTWISYMLDSQMYGLKPWGFHLTNVLLHAATTVILFLVLRRMTGNLWASAFVTFLFAIHPLRAEAVAWVAERKGPLSGLFFVSTLAAYVAYARRPFSLARYLAVAGLFTLGLLAKPTLVTLPFLLLLLDYWPLGRWRPVKPGAAQAPAGDPGVGRDSPLRLVVEKIPLLLLSVAGSVAAVLSQTGNIAPLKSVPIPARIANALISCAVYLGQFFWPVRLAVHYPYSENLPAWQVEGAFLVLAALSVTALMLWRKQPALLVGWLWYLGTLVPMIGLVQIGQHARADRYTYLPHIGLCIAVVWGVSWGVERLWGAWPSRRWLYGVGGTLVVAGLMACAWRQTSYWQNSEALWTHTLACTSQNDVAHYGLGTALAGRGQVDEAIAHYRKALEIEPNAAKAHIGLGVALASRGQVDEAIAHYRKALEIKPDFAEAHYNIGVALAGRGQVDEAIAYYWKALEIKPDYAEAHHNLGVALAGRGLVDEAIAHYRKVLEITPDYAETHNNLGVALAGRGQVDEAITHYRKALKIKPDYAQAHYNLGNALASRGILDEALEHYQKALGLASARNDKAMVDAIRARIRLHESVAPAGNEP